MTCLGSDLNQGMAHRRASRHDRHVEGTEPESVWGVDLQTLDGVMEGA